LYIHVEFKAWQYSGTDFLWASLLDELLAAVKKECGQLSYNWYRAGISLSSERESDDIRTKNLKRKIAVRSRITRMVTYVLVFMVFIITYFYFIFRKDKGKTADTGTTKVNPDTAPSLLTQFIWPILFLIPALYSPINILMTVLPDLWKVRNMIKEAKDTDSSQRTGFMGEVKKEVCHLFEFVKTHHVDDDELKIRRPIRLFLFFDDLDRCEYSTVMDVLEAVMLLLIDAPITCLVAVDSRFVVTSIEDKFGEKFSQEGLGGYSYLEKLVQLPFCIPNISGATKKNFVQKTLEDKELTPLRIYNRVRFLDDRFDKENLLEGNSYVPTNDKVIIEKLVGVFEKMIDLKLYLNNYQANVVGGNPITVLAKVKEHIHGQNSEWQKWRDQFLHLISIGIEQRKRDIEDGKTLQKSLSLLQCGDSGSQMAQTKSSEQRNSIMSHYSSQDFEETCNGANYEDDCESSDYSECSEIERGDLTNGVEHEIVFYASSARAASQRLRQEPLQPTETATEEIDKSFNMMEINQSELFSGKGQSLAFSEIQEVSNSLHMSTALSVQHPNVPLIRGDDYELQFQPLANSTESGWFNTYSKYLIGKPRKIKRIVNSYMVARFVAMEKRSDLESTGVFYNKLLKLTILMEQWPYRMAWIWIFVEKLHQEIEIKNDLDENQAFSNMGISESLISRLISITTSAIERQNPKSSISFENFHNVPLFKIYRHMIQVLIHASEAFTIELQRDGDPQVFEQILLEGNDSKLTVSDIAPPDQLSCENITLRPYSFNLQRHTVEKVSAVFENYMRISRKDDSEMSESHYISESNYFNESQNYTTISETISEDQHYNWNE